MSTTKTKTSIAIARGDGIAPEIMNVTLQVLEASGAALDIHEVEIGEKVYLRGFDTGIEPQTWETIRNTAAFLKAPITTPQGGGFKSLNVTIRTSLGLYANVRPCVSYHPFVATKHPKMDVVIVRENEEDLYTGIEYRQSHDAVHALKIISRSGCERIVRYAFEYAKANNRKKVTCFTKDNILKLSDGLFHQVFEEIAQEYPEIENEHWIVDIGAAKLADTPENFDVIVLPNLYGDILSDVAAQIAGSVGLAGSANIGEHAAMFEAIHGSAPRRAGQNLANPSGLLLAGVQMLCHINHSEAATTMHNAWLKTIEDGYHTYDIFKEGVSREKVGTKEFGEEVIKRMGQKPEQFTAVQYEDSPKDALFHKSSETESEARKKKCLVGLDIFVDTDTDRNVETLQRALSRHNTGQMELKMISNRGTRMWPDSMPETSCIDQWRCRFMNKTNGQEVKPAEIIELLGKISAEGIDFIKTENLYTFDGEAAYSSANNR
jgi:isocitrate dehydrogenase